MTLEMKINGSKDIICYTGDRIEVLDFVLEGIEYKQIRVFRKGFSKSELIAKNLIKSLKLDEK